MLECVVNVSEGRRLDVIDELAASCGRSLLDVHIDEDHHRSVFTLAGDVDAAVTHLERAAMRLIDISTHRGVHPRLGVVDVVPFVALDIEEQQRAVGAAQLHAEALAAELDVPTFLYGVADPEGRSLPEVRRDAFTKLAPDFGPPEPHPTFGATAVGARLVLVAINCELVTNDAALAQQIARSVRHAGGGLPGVRALGFALESKGRSQVSMNLTDLSMTGVEAACTMVRDLARAAGTDVAEVELVGLLPAAELERCSEQFIEWAGLRSDQTIEARLERTRL